MKTATDLREIKKLARMFVMLDIQNTEYSPLIVKHPFTDSGMVAYRTEDGGIAQADITSDPATLELWQQEKFRQIKEARTSHEISFMITKSYSLAFLKYAARTFQIKTFRKCSLTYGYEPSLPTMIRI